jgi:hypothetical protein
MPHPDLNFLAAPGLLWWVALLLALLVGVWAYHRLPAPLRGGERALLRWLRLLALVLLLALLLEPLLTVRRAQAGRPRLAVLVDRSSSMRLPGSHGGTRQTEAESTLVRLEQALGGRFELQVAGFAGELEARRDPLPVYPWKPQGATALGEALESAMLRQADAPLGGILLLSDGVHTAGKDPAQVARNLPAPVFAVVLGDSVALPDLVVREVGASPIVQVGEPTALRVVLQSQGMEGWQATVTVRPIGSSARPAREPGPIVAQRQVRLAPGAQGEVALSLEFAPRQTGLVLYEVEATVPDSEAVRLNNRRWVALDVRERKTRVLYLEGEPDWDFTFRKRAFDGDTTLAYTCLVRQKDGGFRSYGGPAISRVPASRAELSPFAAVLVGRLLPTELPPGFVDGLKGFLLDGGGVLFLSTPSWEASGWSELLPVRVTPQPRLGHALSPCQATFDGVSHEITALSENPAETERLWRALPPLWVPEGSYATAPGARVLLTTQTAQPARSVPLFAVASAGSGRVAVLTGRGGWRWDFAMRGGDGGATAVPDFWKRTVRWLSEPAERSRFDVRPERAVFQDGEPIPFAGRLFDAAFEPIEGARLSIEVAPADTVGPGEDARRASRLMLYPQGAAGRYAGTAAALPPGMYRYRAEAVRGTGDERWNASGVFWVESMGPEFLRLANSARTLREIARRSGGQLASAAELGPLLDAVPRKYRPAQVVRQAEIWNHWIVFAILTALLSLEWGLRRRRGLA